MSVGVGIDIGSRSTRVVKLERRGEQVRWAGSVCTATDADDLGARLRASVGVPPGGAVCGLSGSSVIRYWRVAAADGGKLRMRVGSELAQGGEADVSFDCRRLDLPAGAKSAGVLVLTAVATNEALRERLAGLARSGVRGADFAPDPLALYEVFSRCAESRESFDEYCLVLDIGAAKTEMIIVHNGGLIFVRSMDWGGRDFTRAMTTAAGIEEEQAERLKTSDGGVLPEDAVAQRPPSEQHALRALAGAAEEFFGAIRSSVTFACAQTKLTDLEIGRIYLSGAGARLKGLAEFLAARFGVRASPFQPPDDWGPPQGAGEPCEWMIALGLALLALQRADERMSLLPAAERRRRRFWGRDVFAYAACAVFAAAAAVSTVTAVRDWTEAGKALEERAAQARAHEEELGSLARGNEQRRERLRLLGSAAGAGAQFAEFVEFVKKNLPGSVALSYLAFRCADINELDGRPAAALEGAVSESGKKMEEVMGEFVRLMTSRSFTPPGSEAPKLEQPGKKPDGSGPDFRLRMPLRNVPGKER